MLSPANMPAGQTAGFTQGYHSEDNTALSGIPRHLAAFQVVLILVSDEIFEKPRNLILDFKGT